MSFNPRALKYDEDGVPFLSATEIEKIASEVLEKYHPEALTKPCPTRIGTIIEGLNKNTGLLFAMADLGYVGNAKILGKVNFPNKILSLDYCLTADWKPAFNFTAGHEIGHWILHRHNWRNFKLRAEPQVEEFLDNETTLCRLEKQSAKDWLEYQANVFSTNLVMPSEPFHCALIEAQRSIGIRKNLGMIFLNEQNYSTRDYQRTVDILSHQFDVSKESVKVRLRTRELVIEERGRIPRPISELLSISVGDF